MNLFICSMFIRIILVFTLFSWSNVCAQFIFPESFVMIPIDTARKHVGLISASFNSQTQKNIVTQIGTKLEFAMRVKQENILTMAGNFEFVQNGQQRILSGGYLFSRFRDRISRRLHPEFMAQYQWFEVRGMEHKFALTSNGRFRIMRNKKITLATAAGLLLEFEKWGYTGVRDEALVNINDKTPVNVWNPRFNMYFSYDHLINDKIELDMALHYFVRLDPEVHRTRYGGHSRVRFNISKHLSYRMMLKMMYEVQPVVPIQPLWYQIFNEIVFVF